MLIPAAVTSGSLAGGLVMCKLREINYIGLS